MSTKSQILLVKPEKHGLFTLSVSKAKTFKDCKAKYRFSYIEKLPKKSWDYHVFGKFLHQTLELFYQKIITGIQSPPNQLLTDAWREALAKWKEKLTPEQIKDARKICTLFLQQYTVGDSLPTVLAVEKPFWINIDNKVLLNGSIDRVQLDSDGVIHVTDYKTSNAKSLKYLKKDFFQLLTYAYVMCLEDPNLQTVRASYIMLRHNLETLVKEFNREEIMKIEESFLDYAKQISQEKLFRPKATPLCGFCDFLDACETGQEFVGTAEMKFGADQW